MAFLNFKPFYNREGSVLRDLHFGGSLDPHAAFLLKRGLKTLALRVRYQNDSTQRIAQFLETHPAVARVNYPGLESHPRHARARRFSRYGSGCATSRRRAIYRAR